MRAAGPVTMILDFIEALLLGLVLLVISPLNTLRNLLRFNTLLMNLQVLGRCGILASIMRSLIDERMGRTERAISILEASLATLEDEHMERPSSANEKVLEWGFSWLTNLYLHIAQIDDAALTVIRANKAIGITRLNGLGELDVKTAHIIKAGIAAGRLLDEHGTATFMVQAGELETRKRGRFAKENKKLKEEKRSSKKIVSTTGKVIPFPLPQKT